MSRTFELGEIYDRAKSAARTAIRGSGNGSYGLTDVMSEEDWGSLGSSAIGSLVPVNATLSGCIEALRERGISAVDVGRVSTAPPAGTSVTSEDVAIARDWLVKGFEIGDADGEKMIIDEALERGWVGKPERITSLVLALVVVADVATT